MHYNNKLQGYGDTMDDINEIILKQAVIHILDNSSDTPVLNEFPMKLNEESYNFILRHIEKSLKDEEIRPCKFINSDNIVLQEIIKYGSHGDLVSISKAIAARLFKIMREKGDISPCDLLIVEASIEGKSYICIMKLDYIKNYMHNIDFIEDKIGINIIPSLTGLPSLNQKVSKCAFVNVGENVEDYELLVLERVLSTETPFFSKDFLNCEFLITPRDDTKKFVDATEKWTRKNVTAADYQERLRSSIKAKLKNEAVVNVDTLSQELFKDQEEVKENFKEFLTSKGTPNEIQVDKDFINKKFKRVRLKLDKDMDIYVNEEVYNDSSRFDIERNGDGTINIVIKNVKNYIEK